MLLVTMQWNVCGQVTKLTTFLVPYDHVLFLNLFYLATSMKTCLEICLDMRNVDKFGRNFNLGVPLDQDKKKMLD